MCSISSRTSSFHNKGMEGEFLGPRSTEFVFKKSTYMAVFEILFIY